MRKKIRVGRATDGLMGGRTRKPRNYVEIDDLDGESVVAKIMTHDDRNSKHVEKMNNGFRKRVPSYHSTSIVDRSLYVEKADKKPIRTKELDFENGFEFSDKESQNIRLFIFSTPTNRKRYINWRLRHKKKK